MKHISTLIIFLLSVSILSAQIQIYDNNSYPFPILAPTNIITTPGVTIANFQVNGINSAYGYFDNGMSTIGIESGLAITTGRLSDAEASSPNLWANTYNALPGDSILSSILGVPTFDATTIEFDVYTGIKDTIEFNMVFASEEYPEAVGSSYNDGFAMTISGAGTVINNIAFLPGTTTPITINTVNQFWNSNYYVDNLDSSNLLPIVYDGFTTPINVQAFVSPGSWYHVRITIADVNDAAMDSGLFFGADIPFSANTPLISGVNTFLTTYSHSGDTIDEQCGQAVVNIHYPNVLTAKDTVYLSVSGTAGNGLDYNTLPPYILTHEGRDTSSFTLTPIFDNLPEGTEYVTIYMQSAMFFDSITIYITDSLDYTFEMESVNACINVSTELNGALNLVTPNDPSYESEIVIAIRDDGSILSPIQVENLGTELFHVSKLESVCVDIEHTSPADLQLFLISPNGEFVTLSKNNGSGMYDYANTCFTPTASTTIAQATPPYIGDFRPETNFSKLNNSSINGLWKLVIYDDVQGNPMGQLKSWTLSFKDIGNVTYNWTSSNPSSLSCTDCERPTVTIDTTTDYTVMATLPTGCTFTNTWTIEPTQIPDTSVVSCTYVSMDSLVASWVADSIATSCEVNINGLGWMSPNNGMTSHVISSLLPNTNVSIQVRCSNDNCIGYEEQIFCTTNACNMGLSASVSDDDDMVGNGSIQLGVIGGTAPYSYTWTGYPANNSNTLTNLFPGTYSCVVTDALGCSATITVNIAGVVDLNKVENVNALTLFPNPVSNLLNIEIDLQESEVIDLQVFDVNGRQVDALTTNDEHWHQLVLDVSSYTNGVYILMFRVGDAVIIERIVKQ